MWVGAEYHFPGHFSYRIPDSSLRFAHPSPYAGPSAIKLAMVSVACRTFGLDAGRRMLESVRGAEVRLAGWANPPIFQAMIKRLKPLHSEKVKKGEVGYELTFGMRGYVLPVTNLRIYLDVPAAESDRVRECMRRLPYLGTSDSIVCFVRDLSEADLRQEKEVTEFVDVGKGEGIALRDIDRAEWDPVRITGKKLRTKNVVGVRRIYAQDSD